MRLSVDEAFGREISPRAGETKLKARTREEIRANLELRILPLLDHLAESFGFLERLVKFRQQGPHRPLQRGCSPSFLLSFYPPEIEIGGEERVVVVAPPGQLDRLVEKLLGLFQGPRL